MRGLSVALAVFLWLSVAAGAESPVYFADSALEQAVEEKLGVSDPTPSDMLALTSLTCLYKGMSDLTGLESATNLWELSLCSNSIADLSPLSGLTNLGTLILEDNLVSDLSPLSGLADLRILILESNLISDISPLLTLTSLIHLNLGENPLNEDAYEIHIPQIAANNPGIYILHERREHHFVVSAGPGGSVISPGEGEFTYEGRTEIMVEAKADPGFVFVGWTGTYSNTSNPFFISVDEDFEIRANFMSISGDPNVDDDEPNDPEPNDVGGSDPLENGTGEHHFVVSAGPGGSVVSPGEGEFTYEGRTDIMVEAKADPGFVFARWTGTYSDTSNPFFISVDKDSEIRANFISTSAILYVDDDAPNDPGPNDAAISDPLENGTREHPFDRIQEAIEVAAEGAAIFVQAGTYRETIDVPSRQIELTGFDPNDPNHAFWPVIDGGGNSPVVDFTRGEDPNCVLAGFVITGGKGQTGTAIRCMESSPTIVNCLIAGNRATHWSGAAILCTDSYAAFVNCTVTDNDGGDFGAGLSILNGRVTVVNSILWGNRPKDITTDGDLLPIIHYSVLTSNWPSPGNLNADPLFAGAGRWLSPDDPAVTVMPNDPGAIWSMGDYHVQSQTGRWEPETGEWVQDETTSLCIDGGDPTVPPGPEPLPNGGIINIGAYGGTIEASKSQPPDPIP